MSAARCLEFDTTVSLALMMLSQLTDANPRLAHVLLDKKGASSILSVVRLQFFASRVLHRAPLPSSLTVDKTIHAAILRIPPGSEDANVVRVGFFAWHTASNLYCDG